VEDGVFLPAILDIRTTLIAAFIGNPQATSALVEGSRTFLTNPAYLPPLCSIITDICTAHMPGGSYRACALLVETQQAVRRALQVTLVFLERYGMTEDYL